MGLAVGGYTPLSDGVAPTSGRPEAGEVGMTISQVWRWSFLRGFNVGGRRFLPRKTGPVGVRSSKRLILVQAITDRHFILDTSGRRLGLRGRNQTREAGGECN